MLCGESWGGCGDAALFVRVGFSDDRRLVVLVVLVVFVVFVVLLVVPLVVLVVFVIIVVGVSRRQHVNDGDDARVDQPGGNVFNRRSHVGSCRMSRHSWTDVSSRTRRRERGPGSAQARTPPRTWVRAPAERGS